MAIQMSLLPVGKISLNVFNYNDANTYEFTIDCDAVYFGAVYNAHGELMNIDQYFYSRQASHDDLETAINVGEQVLVDREDFPTKTYLLVKEMKGEEWLRFHAVVPARVNTRYFRDKYLT